MSGVRTSSLSLPSSLRNWVILDYEEANGLTIRPWAPVFSPFTRSCRSPLFGSVPVTRSRGSLDVRRERRGREKGNREDKERTRDWQIIRGYRWASCLPHTLLFTPISSRRFLTAFGHLLISYGVNRKCNEPWVTEERRRRERTMNDGENKIQIRR